MAALSDFSENTILDWLLRGQSRTPPATTYVGLFTASETDAGGGTEVSGGSYARQAVTSSLANWAGTQSAGSTSASSGTSGTTSNNVAITIPAPVGTVVVGFGVFDALTGGNLIFYGALSPSYTFGSTAAVFPPGALTFQIDN